MKNFNILIFIFINIIHCSNNSEVEYLIFTASSFSQHANRIKNLYTFNDCENIQLESECNNTIHCEWHNSCYEQQGQIDEPLSLVTKILYKHQIANENIKSYLFDQNNNYFNNGTFTNLKYLLIIGDENIILPSGECIDENTLAVTDDFFSSQIDQQSLDCLANPPIPLLRTGRLLINDSESFEIIEDIENYVLTPNQGMWQSELLLISDDQYKTGNSNINVEKWHTLYSDSIYVSLKNNLNISCLYGPDFDRQQSTDWFNQPDFSDKIINKINNGLSMINYIGHGTHQVLAHEQILTFSDIERIHIENNKLPVWIVGTCSFGKYNNEISFSEKLLQKGDAAIAIISTTGGVAPSMNFDYLYSLFNTHLKNHLDDANSYARLGDIFYNAKSSSNISYLYHLFGDPAMPLNISKYNNNLHSFTPPINIGSSNTLAILEDGNSYVKIYDQKKYKYYCENCPEDYVNDPCHTTTVIDQSNTCSEQNLITYYIPGDILFLGSTNNNSINFFLPIDVNENNSATIKVYNDFNSNIQIQPNIQMENNIDLNIFNNDTDGPNITMYHNNKIISNESRIYPPYNIKIIIEDENPINLSGINSHNILFWFDNKKQNGIILNDEFSLDETSNSNQQNYYSLTINNFLINTNLITNTNHSINIEAFDILNQRGHIERAVNFGQNDVIYNVYNFPNPFNEKTFFTFGYSNSSPIDVNVDIYSLNGKKIKTISQKNISSNADHFYKIPVEGWYGISENGKKIANGTYVYHLKIFTTNGIKLHEDTYKLTKLE